MRDDQHRFIASKRTVDGRNGAITQKLEWFRARRGIETLDPVVIPFAQRSASLLTEADSSQPDIPRPHPPGPLLRLQGICAVFRTTQRTPQGSRTESGALSPPLRIFI